MVINFSNIGTSGGGSGSGVTPEQVQQQIDSSLTPYWDSAATEDAISAATSGKADAANVTPNGDYRYFPKWNEQGIITDKIGSTVFESSFNINNVMPSITVLRAGWNKPLPHIYAPTTSGNAGEVLVSLGDGGAPVWSAVTMPDMSEYTPTSGFSTINGSAITEGGNLIIEGGSAADATLLKHTTAFPESAETGDVVAKVTEGEAMLSWTYPGDFPLASITSATVTNTFNWNDFPMNTPYTIASWTSVGNHQMEVVAKRQVKTQNGATWEEITLYLYSDGEEVKQGTIDPEIPGANSLSIQSELLEDEYLPAGDFKSIYFDGTTANTGEDIQFVVFAEYGEEYEYYTNSLVPILGLQSFGPASGETIGVYQYDGANWGEVKPDLSAYYTSAETEDAIASALGGYYTSGQTDEKLALYTPTSGFATVNGSAITDGGNLIIEAGDIQTLQDQVDEIEEVVADALVNLNNTKVSSTYVSDIWKGTQAEFDVQTQSGATADPNTFYIIVNN